MSRVRQDIKLLTQMNPKMMQLTRTPTNWQHQFPYKENNQHGNFAKKSIELFTDDCMTIALLALILVLSTLLTIFIFIFILTFELIEYKLLNHYRK